MKKKIVLSSLLALICVIAALGFWQRNNISAVLLSLRTSREDLTAQMEDSRSNMLEAARETSNITIPQITDEQKSALQNNALSRDELIRQMVDSVHSAEAPGEEVSPAGPPEEVPAEIPEKEDPVETPVEKPAPQERPAEKPAEQVKEPEAGKPSQEELRKQLTAYLAELYVMQEEYTTWLEDTHQAAIDEFFALPKEKQTTANKYAVGMRYMNMGLEKEKECDALMADLEAKIEALLIQLGDSTDLVEEIHKTYLNEKALKKAYYLGLH